jgi:hypothetical protein
MRWSRRRDRQPDGGAEKNRWGGLMARARNIKPGFFKNEDLAECSPWARLCFAGLWTLADREGRLEDRPKRIKGEIFPFDTVDVEPLLQELQRFKFIQRYETDGMKAIQILGFARHQSPHYSESQSVIKPPELPEAAAHHEDKKPENSWKQQPIKRGSQPPDSLIPDSLIPDTGKQKARKRAAAARLVTVEAMVSEGVDPQHASDWLVARAKKQLPLTLTAWEQTKAEARKAGLTVADAIKAAAGNGWAGFKATWLQPDGRHGATAGADIFAGAM